ncbi:type II toxin-antitoxin system PemK/MazF family toxin [Propionicimonas sp.]|uniref:type II toxin-antitoxin system PemK/MazF family toxin n=1 Tax=Propionicimonas sp. TaxID=1955623 RepID=UPI0039E554F8
MTLFTRIGRAVLDALSPRLTSPSRRTGSTRPPASETLPAGGSDYPGDFVGRTTLTYAPRPGNTADPGEVVWTWVPFEEDHSQGKDRPVLVIGSDGPWLLALPMTSKDHDRDAAQEAREGRYWVDIGSGGWDARGRASEVRVNRIVRVDPARVRRISARVDPGVFAGVAAAVRSHW